jgi:hypothetical protein
VEQIPGGWKETLPNGIWIVALPDIHSNGWVVWAEKDGAVIKQLEADHEFGAGMAFALLIAESSIAVIS